MGMKVQLRNVYVLAAEYLSGFISYHFLLRTLDSSHAASLLVSRQPVHALFPLPEVPFPTRLVCQALSFSCSSAQFLSPQAAFPGLASQGGGISEQVLMSWPSVSPREASQALHRAGHPEGLARTSIFHLRTQESVATKFIIAKPTVISDAALKEFLEKSSEGRTRQC